MPALKSWVESANGHAVFPLENLPLGVFSEASGPPRGGVAIGDEILDLQAAVAAGLFSGAVAQAAAAAAQSTLNDFFARGSAARRALRTALADLLRQDGTQADRAHALRGTVLRRAADCTLHLPATIGDYTDFYAGIHHANNVGRMLRPDNPLMPNYKYVPIGYHGRSSSIRPSGVDFHRPSGQLKPAQADAPFFAPSKRLDYEMEIGVWIGPGNDQGTPIPMASADDHIAGLCLLNDWSARDVQGWEYQPLGPFLAKNFATTISPWVIAPEALAPFRIAQPPRPAGDPAPLPYLSDPTDQARGAYDIEIEVLLLSAAMRARGEAPHRLSRGNMKNLYWTLAQLVAHHSSGGCNLRPGDLFGSGTISSPDASGYGSLLEIGEGGKKPLTLPSGETRTFLEDGDEIIMRAAARGDGYTIGFGDCRARVLPAK